jgi:hypothetical protein
VVACVGHLSPPASEVDAPRRSPASLGLRVRVTHERICCYRDRKSRSDH